VRAQRDIPLAEAGMDSKYVTHIVDANIIQPDLAKTLGQPRRSRRLAKRGRTDARHLRLPLCQLRLLGAKPVKCRSHFR
jgi:hypothetical protein